MKKLLILSLVLSVSTVMRLAAGREVPSLRDQAAEAVFLHKIDVDDMSQEIKEIVFKQKLFSTIKNENIPEIRRLLEYGINVSYIDSKDDESFITLLSVAASHGAFESVKFLFNCKEEKTIFKTSPNVNTMGPLAMAAANRFPEIVRYLVGQNVLAHESRLELASSFIQLRNTLAYDNYDSRHILKENGKVKNRR